MFINNIDPVLLSLGPLEVRYYGLVYLLGFFLALIFLQKNRNSLKIGKEEVYDLSFYFMLGIVLGARLFAIFGNWSYYWANPLKMIALWEGGMSFHGGLIGAALAVYLYCKYNNVNFAKVADILSIPTIFALALGRLTNFTNQELYGPITNVNWCVQFQGVDGCRHPYQIYSAIKRTIVGVILIWIDSKHHKNGFVFWNMVWMLGAGRLFLDFYRVDELVFGLTKGQYGSIIMIILGFYVLYRYYWNDVKDDFFKI